MVFSLDTQAPKVVDIIHCLFEATLVRWFKKVPTGEKWQKRTRPLHKHSFTHTPPPPPPTHTHKPTPLHTQHTHPYKLFQGLSALNRGYPKPFISCSLLMCSFALTPFQSSKSDRYIDCHNTILTNIQNQIQSYFTSNRLHDKHVNVLLTGSQSTVIFFMF